MGFFPLINTIQHYAWGSSTAIPTLLGIENSGGAPMAELWMGTHPAGPSRVVHASTTTHLRDLLQSDPATHLGEPVAGRFSGELPFLFKVLAAEQALSIQVHPTLDQAQAGFDREETQGIARDDTRRNYKDRNHKPEILCALTHFEGLSGFRGVPEIRADFEEPEFDRTEAAALRSALSAGGDADAVCRGFLREVLAQGPRSTGALVSAALALADRVLSDHPADEVDAEFASVPGGAAHSPDPVARFRWVRRLAVQFPGDIGVLAPLYLNLVSLSPGQAVFLSAGTLHAYLRGVGVELMAASDNVLRGGLTSKHIDRDELLRVVDCSVSAPVFIDGCARQVLRSRTNAPVGFAVRYATPAAEFRLERCVLEGDDPVQIEREPTPQIALCIGGRARFMADGQAQTISRGDALFISATHTSYLLSGPGELYLASVPLEGSAGCID